MFCKYCGKEIKDDSVFCKYCSKNIVKKENKKTETTIHEENAPVIVEELQKSNAESGNEKISNKEKDYESNKAARMKFCVSCGAKIGFNAAFCPFCKSKTVGSSDNDNVFAKLINYFELEKLRKKEIMSVILGAAANIIYIIDILVVFFFPAYIGIVQSMSEDTQSVKLFDEFSFCLNIIFWGLLSLIFAIISIMVYINLKKKLTDRKPNNRGFALSVATIIFITLTLLPFNIQMISGFIEKYETSANLSFLELDADVLNNACRTVYSGVRSGTITTESKENNGEYCTWAAETGASNSARQYTANAVKIFQVQAYNGTSINTEDFVFDSSGTIIPKSKGNEYSTPLTPYTTLGELYYSSY